MLPSPEITQELFPFYNRKRVSQKSQEYVHKGGNDESHSILGNIVFSVHLTSILKAYPRLSSQKMSQKHSLPSTEFSSWIHILMSALHKEVLSAEWRAKIKREYKQLR